MATGAYELATPAEHSDAQLIVATALNKSFYLYPLAKATTELTMVVSRPPNPTKAVIADVAFRLTDRIRLPAGWGYNPKGDPY